jgi:hypothetical protein
MSEKIRGSRCWWLLLVTLALACSSSPQNIGDGELKVDKAELGSYAATWDGYVEAYAFSSGTDRIHLSLDATGNGSFRVGDGADLPPPTNPDVGYPAALASDPATLGVGDSTRHVFDGVAYPVANTHVDSERIRLTVDPHSAFVAWCAMQTPAIDPGTTPPFYGCAPSGWSLNGTGECLVGSSDEDLEPIDCGKLVICNFGCVCDASSCSARPSYDPIELDAALDDSGHNLVGTLLLGDYGVRTLRLKR